MLIRPLQSCGRTSSNTLSYRRLPETDEIRLLKLNGHSQGQVSGSLEIFSLQETPDFYALSYTWGKQKPTSKFKIDGEDLHVTPSLQHALTRLSDPNGPAKSLTSDYFWIDQICIDQGHLNERRHQVTLMGSIYSKALSTVIWLGEDKSRIAELAFSFGRQIEQLYLRDVVTDDRGVASHRILASPFEPQVITQNDLPPLEDPRWAAFNTLLRNAWFTRLWVQQEAILSGQDPLFVLGSRTCPFQTLARAYAWLDARDFHQNEMITRRGENLQQIFDTREMRALGVKKELSCMLKTMSQGTQASDPRDKVFGLLGVARFGEEKLRGFKAYLRVDYNPEYTATEVYMDAARDAILRTSNLAILAGPKLRNDHVRDVYRSFGRQGKWAAAPSWVPSFDRSFQPRTEYTTPLFGKKQACALDDGHDGFFLMQAWRVGFTASKTRPISLALNQNSSADGIKHTIHSTEQGVTSTFSDALVLHGLLVDSVLSQQEITTGIAAGMQTYGLFHYFDCGTYSERSIEHVGSLQRQFGWVPRMHYLWQTVYSGCKEHCVVRLWETALQLTNRPPEELARALFFVATGGYHPNNMNYNESEVMRFLLWLRDVYVKGYGGGRGIRRLRKKGLHHAAEWLQTVAAPKSEPHKWNFLAIFEASMWNWANLKRFFVTKNGRLGIGPAGMREGDKLCVLFGGGVPFVLRRHENHWLMIGEAYVDGYMKGEAIDALEKGDLQEEAFEIR